MRLKRSISNLRLLLKRWQYLVLMLLMGGLLVLVAIDYRYEHNLWGLIELSPSGYLVEHRIEILLALLAPQIPLLIFVFETASRTVFVRKTVLRALSFREFLFILMSLGILIIVYQHPSVVIPLFGLVFVLDLVVFEIAYQLSNRSGHYKNLVEDHLSKLVSDALSCIEDNAKKHTRHTIEDARDGLVEVLDDISEGMNDAYTPLRTSEYLELLRWLGFVENSIDRVSLRMLIEEKEAGFADNKEIGFNTQPREYEVVHRVIDDVIHGPKNWDRPRAMAHQKLVGVYKDQLQNALDHNNGEYASKVVNHITGPLYSFLAHEEHDQDINPFTVIRSDLLLRRLLKSLIRRRHSAEATSRAHEIAEFMARECLESYFGTLFPFETPLHRATRGGKEGSGAMGRQVIEGVYVEVYLKTLNEITVLSLRYDHQELFCRLIDIYKDLDSRDAINLVSGKEFGEYVRCNLLTIYYYIRYHCDLVDAYPRDTTIDDKKYEPLLKILGGWGISGLTKTFESLEANYYDNPHRWYVADLDMIPNREVPQEIQGGPIDLLWLDLLLDPATGLRGCIPGCSKDDAESLRRYLSRLNAESGVGPRPPNSTGINANPAAGSYPAKKKAVENMIEKADPE